MSYRLTIQFLYKILFSFLFLSHVHFFFKKIISISVSISFIFIIASSAFSVHIIRRIIQCLFPDFSSILEDSHFPSPMIWESSFFLCRINEYILFFYIRSTSGFLWPEHYPALSDLYPVSKMRAYASFHLPSYSLCFLVSELLFFLVVK